MKHNLIIISLSLCSVLNMYCQTFQFKVNNPYGLELNNTNGTQTASKLLFYDLDADGDLDAVVTGIDSIDFTGNFTYSKITYFIAKQENIGDKKHPVFAPREPFMSIFPMPNGYFYPVIGDLNDDNKPDLIVSSGLDDAKNLQTLYYKRTSITGDDQFTIIGPDSLELPVFVGGSLFIPELADFDKDGDLDLLMSGYQLKTDSLGNKIQQPIFMYAKNIGSTINPQFLGWYQNSYGLEDYISTLHIVTSGDIDNDNDLDLISLSVVDTFKLVNVIKNNILSNGKPDFNHISLVSGIPIAGNSESYSPPTLADLDGDGDLDIFMIQELISNGNGIGYYENNLCISSSVNVDISICSGESVTIGNQVFQTAGEYDILIQKQNLCDSLIHLSLTVRPEFNTNLSETLCAGEVYTIGNQPFTQTGQYDVILSSSNGCDSIIHLSLTVYPSFNTNHSVSLCEGEVFTIGSQPFTQTGQYDIILNSIHGCDSLIHLSLTAHPEFNTNLSASLCAGDVFTIGNQPFTQTGQYDVILSSIYGCDSLIHLNLTFHPETNSNLSASICSGEVFTIGNQPFTQTGQYEIVLSNIHGCDSLIHLNLTVHPEETTNLTQSLCAGDIFIIGNQQFTQTGQYDVTLKTVHGCDSIVHALLTFVELNNAVTQSQIVLTAVLSGVQYQWFNCSDGSDISGATAQSFQPALTGSYGVRLTDSNGCSRVSDCFDVIISDITEVNFAEKISIYPNPTGSFVTIKNESGQKIKSVSFFDRIGQLVLKISDGLYENINVSGLTNGNYLVEINGDQFKVNHQLSILK
ncbi:MAG: T9SS type A sorting domain-containing protein [Saprospiraceae bacterium]|nr:T9SS type A sorting domain-containing protein [Saprospiraceae bacterium]